MASYLNFQQLLHNDQVYRRPINTLTQQPWETVVRDILIEQYFHSGLTLRLVTKVLKL